MNQEKNIVALFEKIESENLYAALIAQLNKDFRMSNLDESFSENSTTTELQIALIKILHNLIKYKYDDYLNLLYRIDVPEKELAAIKDENLEDSIPQVAFIVLKREVQKVWLRNKFK